MNILNIGLISYKRDPSLGSVDADGGSIIVRNLMYYFAEMGHMVHVYTKLTSQSSTPTISNDTKHLIQTVLGGDTFKIGHNITIHRIAAMILTCRRVSMNSSLKKFLK